MSNTDWRLSGGIGEPLDPDAEPQPQVMTQGLGFPLRPVSGVPPQGSGDDLSDENVAQGLFMTFMPNGYEEGKLFPAGSVVSDGTWQMIANTLTLDYPYPLLTDAANFGLPAYAPATQSDLSVVYSGHHYTFNETCYASELRVWVTQLTVDTNYRIVVVRISPTGAVSTTVIEEPVLSVGAWKTVALLNEIIRAGTKIQIFIDALNSGADNEVTGGWSYTGQSNNGAPAAQSWNVNNARTTLRIDKTDLDATDRTAELLGITVDSTIVFADTDNPSAFDQYRTTGAPVDQGTYISYTVVRQEQGEGGVPTGVTTMTATVPIPQATEYAETTGSVPVYTQDVDVIGFLQFNGVDQVGDANSYGIDIEIDGVTGSPDWTVFSSSTP